jgi:hypothetical protein
MRDKPSECSQSWQAVRSTTVPSNTRRQFVFLNETLTRVRVRVRREFTQRNTSYGGGKTCGRRRPISDGG